MYILFFFFPPNSTEDLRLRVMRLVSDKNKLEENWMIKAF